MQKRLIFKCWHCTQTYSELLDPDQQPEVVIVCPHCDREGIADLSVHRKKPVDVYRFQGDNEEGKEITFSPSEIIQTKPT